MGALTTSFLDATGIVDSTISNALNAMEASLSTNNLLVKIAALYPFVGGNAADHAVNFMDVNAYNLTFSGGWTHSSTGSLPNGSTGYADTGIEPNDHLQQFNFHGCAYSRTNTAPGGGTDAFLFGVTNGASQIGIDIYDTNKYAGNAGGSVAATATGQTNFNKLIGVSRTSETALKLFRDTATLGLSTTNVGVTTYYGEDRSIWISALNNSGTGAFYSAREIAFASFGDGFTDTEWSVYVSIVNTFQTALSRNV